MTCTGEICACVL